MLCSCLNGNLKERKQEKGLKGYGLKICCSEHIKKYYKVKILAEDGKT